MNFRWFHFFAQQSKQVVLGVLLFELAVSPVQTRAWAQGNSQSGAEDKSSVSGEHLSGTTEADVEAVRANGESGVVVNSAEGSPEVDQGSTKDNKNSQKRKKRQQVRADEIIEAENRQKVYENGGPNQMARLMQQLAEQKKVEERIRNAGMGSSSHYMALRHSNPEFMHQISGDKTRDRKSPVTATDIRKGLGHFGMESTLFAISMGAVAHTQMFFGYGSNPIRIQQQLDSLYDPIGHLSFYMFMAVNGYTADFLTDRHFNSRHAKGLPIKQSYMKMLPYFSMAAGSLASHFVGDFARSIEECAKGFFNKKPQEKQSVVALGPCEQAWRQWTLEKKFDMYAPTLINMLFATYLSGGASILATKAINELKGSIATSEAAVFRKMTLWGSRIAVFASNDNIPAASFRWIGKMVGKTTQFTLFTGLDALMHSATASFIGNRTRGAGSFLSWLPLVESFNDKAGRFTKLLEEEKQNQWQGPDNLISCDGKKDLMPGLGIYCKKNDLINWIGNFSESMDSWREFNQAHALEGHAAWVQEINSMKSTERLSAHYYDKLITDLRKAEKWKHASVKVKNDSTGPIVKNEEAPTMDELAARTAALEERMAETEDKYESVALRLFPLFGVLPKLTENSNALYMLNPTKLEEDQKAKIEEVLPSLESALKAASLSQGEKAEADKIISQLKSKKAFTMGLALNEMRKISSYLSVTALSEYKRIIRKHYEMLGKPTPIFTYGLGFSYAFMLEASEDVKGYMDSASVDYLFGAYRQEKKVDYLTYQMICGPDLLKQEKLINSRDEDGLKDEFLPPKIIKSELKPDLCDFSPEVKTSSRMYMDPVFEKTQNKKYKSLFYFLLPNLNNDMASIIHSAVEKEGLSFTPWWFKHVEPQIVKRYEQYQKDYETIQVEFVNSLYGNQKEGFWADLFKKGIYNDNLFNEGTVHNGVVYSTMQEVRIYSLILGELVRDLILPRMDKTQAVEILSLKPADKWTQGRQASFESGVDIFRAQSSSGFLDYRALREQKKPQIFDFQISLENYLSYYHQLFSKLKVQKVNDKYQVAKNYTDKDKENLKKQTEATAAKLKTLSEIFESAGYNGESRVGKMVGLMVTKLTQIMQSPDSFIQMIELAQYNRDQKALKEECRQLKGGAGMVSRVTGQCD